MLGLVVEGPVQHEGGDHNDDPGIDEPVANVRRSRCGRGDRVAAPPPHAADVNLGGGHPLFKRAHFSGSAPWVNTTSTGMPLLLSFSRSCWSKGDSFPRCSMNLVTPE